MKTQIDEFMQKSGIDVLLVTGPGQYNPAMVYLTGGGHITTADYIKKAGEPAVLYHAPMERDEASKSGLRLESYSQFPMPELLKETQGDRLAAIVLRYQRMLAKLGIQKARVGLYGVTESGPMLALVDRLRTAMPGLEFVAEVDGSVLNKAMLTKSEDELVRIRQMGKITTTVVGRTADFLTSQRAKEGILVDTSGEPVTIGKVKSLINMWLAELGADNPEGTIFAQGRDAGVPHSSGTLNDPMRLGQTIVYDIFPCEATGGYWYDFTRTWCLGHAPDEAWKLYEDVKTVYYELEKNFKVGGSCPDYQNMTCDFFEELGHKTIREDPAVEEGYMHSLGHGLGLRIHERPDFYGGGREADTLQPGMVFTHEPGLYYPSRGMGVRLENTYEVTPEGEMKVMAPFPMDLVLPVRE
jgi:Xaa-Pro aminopeptidase